MAEPIIRGNPGPIPQSLAYDYDPRNGMATRKIFRGAVATMQGYSAQLIAAGVPHSFTPDVERGDAEIIISSSRINDDDETEETPVDDWEIQGSDASLDLFEHPNSLRLEKASPGVLGFIKQSVKLYNESESPGEFTFTVSLGSSALNTLATQLFNRLIRGGTHFRKEQYVLTHTQTISSAYRENIVDFNVEKIFTFDQLIDEITDAEWTTPCPGRLVAKIEHIEEEEAPDSSFYSETDYKWGWLKSPSTERTVAGNKIQITTNYTLELWSLYEYAVAT